MVGLESAHAPAGGGGGTPVAYGTVAARSPLTPYQTNAAAANALQAELAQLLASRPAGAYVVASAGPNRIQLTLQEPLLFTDGFTIGPDGQALVRDLAATLRRHPGAELTIVGHDDGANPNPLRAYENSTDRAINLAQQLINYGANPARITAGGRGYHDPVGANVSPADQLANRRTDLFFFLPQ